MSIISGPGGHAPVSVAGETQDAPEEAVVLPVCRQAKGVRLACHNKPDALDTRLKWKEIVSLPSPQRSVVAVTVLE